MYRTQGTSCSSFPSKPGTQDLRLLSTSTSSSWGHLVSVAHWTGALQEREEAAMRPDRVQRLARKEAAEEQIRLPWCSLPVHGLLHCFLAVGTSVGGRCRWSSAPGRAVRFSSAEVQELRTLFEKEAPKLLSRVFKYATENMLCRYTDTDTCIHLTCLQGLLGRCSCWIFVCLAGQGGAAGALGRGDPAKTRPRIPWTRSPNDHINIGILIVFKFCMV